MKTVLMVAEKPSLAASLATILSNGKASSRKGFNGSCSVHEWQGTFLSVPARFKMTSVCGHVLGVDFISKYNNWDRVDPVELFSCQIEKKEATPKLRMPHFLAQEAKGADNLVLWLDCDKEGENICFEVMGAVASSMIGNVYSDSVTYRAKFSAITEKDIKAAFNSLGHPNENEALSVDARQELDLRIGCAFTRFQTKFFQGRYGDLDSSLISYGPCQTPTLGFCVQRHDAIQTFKPETYWCLQVTIITNDNQDITLDWQRCRSFDKEVANLFLQIVKEQKKAKVISVVSKEKSKVRPPALNTVELMRVASSGLGMGPHHAMQIAERLYVQGYISYPRTETTRYPENFDLLGTLRQQQHNQEWGLEVREILNNGINRPKSGHDAGDHPPITPMKAASRQELDGDAWKLYDYITRHFIGTLSRDCKYLTTTATIMINDEVFTVSGKTLLDPGFTSIMTWQALGKNEIVPNLMENEIVPIKEAKLTEHQTSPPDYLTESELITLMEKHGIGTDASIPVHINNISQRNYVTVIAGRKLKPTTLGIVLVHGYQKIDPELVLPTMRSAVEEQLTLIAVGKANFQAVLKHTVEIFKLKFQYFVKNIEAMDQLFEVSFSPLSASGKAHSRCGKCRRYMKYIQAKPARLHCPQCDETFSVPQNGIIKLFRELKCPLDDFELLCWTMGNKGKSFVFCPYCYNNPPFKEMKKSSGCNTCVHPTCAYSLNSNGVCNCAECEFGVLVLDPSSGPKWKLGCNKCDTIINLFDDAQKVTVLEDSCDCGAQMVHVEYKPEKSRLPKGAVEAKGCPFCHADFARLVDRPKAAVTSRPRVFRGGKTDRGGRGGRASRGGRGRQPVIRKDAIHGLPKLVDIILEDNNITDIEPGAFHNLTHLYLLKLRYNNIKAIREGVFNGLPLKELCLTNNSIEVIHPNAFDNMPNLTIIFLNENKISALSNDWFKNTPRVVTLNMEKNYITTIPFRVFQNIQGEHLVRDIHLRTNIMLNDNVIRKIEDGAFNSLETLGWLFLHRNEIEDISAESLGSLKLIEWLRLDHNKLKCVPDRLVEISPKIVYYLHANPLTDVCINKYNITKVI